MGLARIAPLLRATVETEQSLSVGKVTIETLEKYKIDFKGSEAGLSSAFGSPIGLDAMEVLSDTEMRILSQLASIYLIFLFRSKCFGFKLLVINVTDESMNEDKLTSESKSLL